MPTMPPQSQPWPADRALLFVHGVGNAQPGDYNPLVAQVQAILGEDAGRFAVYFLYYDQINDWFATKLQASLQLGHLVGALQSALEGVSAIQSIASKVDAVNLGNVIADFAGDVIWPILIADARQAVRAAMLQQLQQIVKDGRGAGLRPYEQHISIVAHSLGCFHTFETLYVAATDESQGLSPGANGVTFDNVIYMASPVQLIKTVAGRIGDFVPDRASLRCLSAPDYACASERTITGQNKPDARRVVSITGNLDPVGGWFLRSRADWAYMQLPPTTGQTEYLSFTDQEELVSVDGNDAKSLTGVLQQALQDGKPPTIAPENPHDWSRYVARHGDQLKQWLLS